MSIASRVTPRQLKAKKIVTWMVTTFNDAIIRY